MHSLPPLHAQASEIQVSAEEEFNIEKLQMVESEKQRIRREYERKEAQIESRKKIERSTKVNAARLRVLRAREECVSVAVKAAREQLAVVVGDQARYGRLLVELIAQAMGKLNEPAVQVRCRQADLVLMQQPRMAGIKPILRMIAMTLPSARTGLERVLAPLRAFWNAAWARRSATSACAAAPRATSTSRARSRTSSPRTWTPPCAPSSSRWTR